MLKELMNNAIREKKKHPEEGIQECWEGIRWT